MSAGFRGAVWEAARVNGTRGRRDEGVVVRRDAASRTGGRGPGVRAARVDRRAGARPVAQPVHHDRHHAGRRARTAGSAVAGVPARRCRHRARSPCPTTTRRTTSRCGCPTRVATQPTSPSSGVRLLTLRPTRTAATTRGSTSSARPPTAPAAALRLTYAAGATQTVAVAFPDWCGTDGAAHVAIGPLSERYRRPGSDGAPCSIFHVPVGTDADKKLVSVTLPPKTSRAAPPQGYLMALTLEERAGTRCSRCRTCPAASRSRTTTDGPVTAHAFDPGRATAATAGTRRGRGSRWTRPTRRAAPASSRCSTGSTAGRSELYSGAFDFTRGRAHARVPRGRPRRQRRAVQGGRPQGRRERARPPSATLDPGHGVGPTAGTTARSRSGSTARDGQGSGTEATRVPARRRRAGRLHGPIIVGEAGSHVVEYRSTDVGGQRRAERSAADPGRRHAAGHRR